MCVYGNRRRRVTHNITYLWSWPSWNIGVLEDSIGYRRDGWTKNVDGSISSWTARTVTAESAYDRSYVDWWENWSSIRILFGGERACDGWRRRRRRWHVCAEDQKHAYIISILLLPTTAVARTSILIFFCFFSHSLSREWELLVRIFLINFVIKPTGSAPAYCTHPWHALVLIILWYTFIQRRPDGRWPGERTMILLSIVAIILWCIYIYT